MLMNGLGSNPSAGHLLLHLDFSCSSQIPLTFCPRELNQKFKAGVAMNPQKGVAK